MALSATGFLLFFRLPDLIRGQASAFDLVMLLVSLGLLLSPVFAEINLFGLKLKREVEGLRHQISNLATEIGSNISMHVYQSSVQAPPAELPEKASEELDRSPTEYKILKTLWTKQVNRFGDLSSVWSFRINMNAPEFFGFREAATKLMKEGLIAETAHGQVYLTAAGFEFCKKHHRNFPPGQWWPEEEVDPEKLEQLLGEGGLA